MTYHIRVCKIDDDDIIFAGLNRLHQLIAHDRCAHLRFQVVGRNLLRRRNQNAVLALVRLFHAAVEEKCYVCIFLGLGDTCLRHMVRRQELSKRVLNLFLLERNQLVPDRLIVIGKAYKRQVKFLLSRKSGKSLIAECTGDLSCTVRTEVEENDGIAILNRGNRLAVLLYIERYDELIVYLFIIGCLNACTRTFCLLTLCLCQHIVSFLDTIPVFITVHRIVASHHGSHLADAKLLHLLL